MAPTHEASWHNDAAKKRGKSIPSFDPDAQVRQSTQRLDFVMFIAALVIGVLAITYQTYVSWHIWKGDVYSRGQQVSQLAIIWLLPVIGAIVVHWVSHGQMRTSDAPTGLYAEPQHYEDHDTNPRIFND